MRGNAANVPGSLMQIDSIAKRPTFEKNLKTHFNLPFSLKKLKKVFRMVLLPDLKARQSNLWKILK